MTSAVKDAEAEYADGNALTEEATKKYKEFNTQVSQLKESFAQLLEAVGKDFLPTLKDIVDKITEVVISFRDMDPTQKQVIENMLGLVAVVGPTLTIMGKLMDFTNRTKKVFQVFSGAEGVGGVVTAIKGGSGLNAALGTASGSLLGILGPVGLVAGGIGLLATITAQWATANEEDLKKVGDDWLATTNALQTDWDTLATVSGTTFDEMGNIISQSTLDTTNELMELWSTTNDNIQRYNEKFSRAVTDDILEMDRTITTDFDTTKTSMTTTSEQLSTDIANDFLQMENDMITAIENSKKSIQTESSEINKTMYKMVKTGVDDIQGLTNTMSTFGRDMMSNLASGIRSAASWVWDAVTSVADGIRRIIHFSEPDVGPLSDFHTYMPDMMKQMARGIRDNSYLVEDALSNVTGSMSAQLQGANTNSYNYGGVVINLNVPEGTNGQMLVDEIETELANRTIRRRAVFG